MSKGGNAASKAAARLTKGAPSPSAGGKPPAAAAGAKPPIAPMRPFRFGAGGSMAERLNLIGAALRDGVPSTPGGGVEGLQPGSRAELLHRIGEVLGGDGGQRPSTGYAVPDDLSPSPPEWPAGTADRRAQLDAMKRQAAEAMMALQARGHMQEAKSGRGRMLFGPDYSGPLDPSADPTRTDYKTYIGRSPQQR